MELSKEKKQIIAQRKIEREQSLNKIIIHREVRNNPITPHINTPRIRFDFQNCPTRTEQHTARETDLNYLIAKFRPDELAAYMAARTAHRREIIGHDFSQEPNLQEAKNIIIKMRKAYEELPENIRNQFNSHTDFLKFIDNPSNQEKLIKMGLLKPKQIEDLTGETGSKDPIKTDLKARTPDITPTTKEAKEIKKDDA